MNKSFAVILFLFLSPAKLFAQNTPPKLVVGIVVDQMRMDYIYRYQKKYSDKGLIRLINDGYVFRNAHFNYIPTYTGPGHASIYTGTTPSRHGVIANNWYSKVLDRSVYCAEDSETTAVGGSLKNGNISAKNLKTTTITDELMLFHNGKSKVVGLAIKDRGAALPAGHMPTGAYWYDEVSGEFMSSTYFMQQLPDWVVAFNKKALAKKYGKQSWTTSLPIEQYTESLNDQNPYENTFGSKKTNFFPYEFTKGKELSEIRTSPFGTQLTMDFAIAAIEGEKMGQDEITDFLAISISSTDYAGHAFGPRSVEVQDSYIKLDLEIQRLLDYLDQNVGEGQYMIFLTADHAVADVPQLLVDRKLPGGYVKIAEMGQLVNEKIEKELGPGEWIRDASNEQLFLDHELIKSAGKDLFDVQDRIARLLLEIPEIAEAIPAYRLISRNTNDPFYIRLQNGYNSKMSGDILVMLQSGILYDNYGRGGTTHGSGYTYDTHVPIIFYGKNVKKGSSVTEVSITDIASTLSMMLNVGLPSGNTGKPLKELFD